MSGRTFVYRTFVNVLLGQRRYLESLNAYARSIVQPAGRPDVDAIYGIAPTVAIEQRVSRGGRKSTVATQTEVHHFLRLLYVKLGVQHCPDCNIPVTPLSFDAIVAQIGQSLRGRHIGVLAPLIIHRKGYYTELAKWAASRGHTHLRVDGKFVPTSPWARLDLQVGPDSEPQLRALVERALELGHGAVQVLWPLDRLRTALQRQQSAELEHRLFSIHRTCPSCGQAFPEPDPRLFSYNSKHGWCPDCFGTGLRLAGFSAEHSGEEIGWNDWYEGEESPCPTCAGQRLNRVALAVRFDSRSIAQTGAMHRMIFGEFDGERSERAQTLLAACEAGGINAEISTDIRRAIWEKFVFLVAMSGATTSIRMTIGPIRQNPRTRAFFLDLMREVLAVGRASGVGLSEDGSSR